MAISNQENLANAASGDDKKLCLCFSPDIETTQLIERVLVNLAQYKHFRSVMGDISDAVNYLRKSASPALLIIDVSSQQDPVVAIEQLANVCEPGVKVIVIGNDDSLEQYRALIDLGISDYLVKPLLSQQVVDTLGRVTGKRKAAGTRQGKEIVITGCSGGVGVSTIAANIARGLAQHGGKVLVADADNFAGDIDLILDAKAGHGILGLLNGQHSIDQLMVERACDPVSTRLSLLKSRGQSQEIIENDMAQIRYALTAQNNFVVWDVAASLLRQPSISNILNDADFKVIICSPTLASLRECNAMLRLLSQQQFSQRTILVLNYNVASRIAMLTKTQLENSLARKFDHVLPYAPAAIIKANELGKSLLNARCDIAAALQNIVNDILGLGEQSLPLFSRMINKISPNKHKSVTGVES